MEVLAGIDDMMTEVRESGCRFRFDFSKVYWNSRLHTEHGRLINMFKKDQRICKSFNTYLHRWVNIK
jgi:tRNA (guanine37-N1)-methyltransferase